MRVKYFEKYEEFLKFIEKMRFGKGEAVVSVVTGDNLKEYIKVVY